MDGVEGLIARKMYGIDIRTTQALLGHKNISSTLIYTYILHQGGYSVSSPLDDYKI